MSSPSSPSLTIEPDLLAPLQAAARWRDMSVDDYARLVLQTATRMDIELAAFVQEGIDAADRGDVVGQDEMEAWFETRYRAAAAE